MARNARRDGRSHVLIAGGGVAAVEAALALAKLAGEHVDVELRSPRREFVYRPFAVGEPYGAARIHRYDLAELAGRCGATFKLGGIVSVDDERRTVTTRDGEKVNYDFLLITPGARMLWAVPGAVTFWGVADEGGVGGVVHRLRVGALRKVIFTAPGGASWPLPLYELVLFAHAVLAKSGVADGQLTVVTPEDAPLDLFGRTVAEQMTTLLEENGIAIVAGVHPVEFDGGRLHIAPGDAIDAQAVVSLPRLEGRRIDGIPHDSSGFVPLEEHCRVAGMEHVFAAGDVTSFPVKQGGIATQQADSAASAIASEAGADATPEPFDPVLRGVLWTGAEPRYLYGRPTGGHGEVSTLTESPPWPEQEGKIIGRYLTPFLTGIPSDEDERRTVAR